MYLSDIANLKIKYHQYNKLNTKDAKKVRPLCIFLPKLSAYRRDFDESKSISFLMKEDE